MSEQGRGPEAGRERKFHLSVSADALNADPDLLQTARDAGVTDVWIAGFLYGHWHYPPDAIQEWRRRAEAAGLAAHVINVPLGHPGDSLGATSGNVPLTPPTQWQMGVRPDGSKFAGTSLHTPATEENVGALRRLAEMSVKGVFLDDDFRLAQGPGVIGGCFCEDHKRRFLERSGVKEETWADLLDSVKNRRLTPVLRAWLEFTCDELTASFKAQQAAAPGIELGIMVMYLGAEKAGIRLSDYRDAPFRVGELMFDDTSFSPPKGKTNELFSALFHRRFARPERAFSETTAFPSDRLSARNMAAKLAVSTIGDVRNTMFMSGITAFPRTHWAVLKPAMAHHADLHRRLVGHTPRGPFKHLWGEAARMVGDDNPYSLFLAAGVPFEVTDKLDGNGWTFLSDADARSLSGGVADRKTLIARPEAGVSDDRARAVPETLPALYELKHEILPTLHDVPFVQEDTPMVCAWYPTLSAVLLWNLSEQPANVSVRFGDKTIPAAVDALDVELVPCA